MAKYKAYPEYKESGVEWLGKIPTHWIRSKFGYLKTILTDYTANGSFADLKSNVTYLDEPSYARLVRLTDLRHDLNNSNGVWIDKSSYNYLSKSSLYGGEFLLANVGAYAGLFYQMPYNKGPASLAPNMFMAKFSPEKISRKFIAYIGQADNISKQLMLKATASSAQPKLNKDDFKTIFCCYPPLNEQVKISAFLDRETAKIDNLIEKQQQLIELLKEKRQAVISHAVTKGLNPDMPMKDSGVEWLGEVPEHWKIKRCKNLFAFVTSGSRGWAGFYSDEGDLFFRIANLTRDSINPKLDSIQYVTPPKGSEGERSKIKENDLLISITADLGSVCAADESISGGYVSQHISLCRPGRLVASSRWLAFFVLSDTAKEQLQGAGYGGTKVQLSLEDIRDLFVAYPPKSEQIKIASYLDERLSELDGLDHRAHNLIELLRERRTALISAAVTGKIDVRDWVAPDTQDVEEPQEATA
ncbi:restriction endonuclease subunit S [Enterobacter hormaechei]